MKRARVQFEILARFFSLLGSRQNARRKMANSALIYVEHAAERSRRLADCNPRNLRAARRK